MQHRGERTRRWVHILRDSLVLLASIALAALLVSLGVVHALASFLGSWALGGAFIAGIFFSSIITTAPAAAVLIELSQNLPPVLVAAAAALGSALADAGLFVLVRGHFAEDARYLLSLSRHGHTAFLGHARLVHYTVTLIGALCIALPFLPDEAGVAILGLSKLSRPRFFLIAYGLNFAGILALGLAARGFQW